MLIIFFAVDFALDTALFAAFDTEEATLFNDLDMEPIKDIRVTLPPNSRERLLKLLDLRLLRDDVAH